MEIKIRGLKSERYNGYQKYDIDLTPYQIRSKL